jgi:isopentenyl phosphate kinase
LSRKGPAHKGIPIRLVKLGGSVITEKAAPDPVLRPEVLTRLAREVVEVGGETVLLHGAGSFGHPGAKRHGLKGGLGREGSVAGAAEVRLQVAKLQRAVCEAVHGAGGAPWPLPASSVSWMRDGKPRQIDWEIFDAALGRGFIPVSGGDVVLDEVIGVSILSADDIVEALSRHLHPSLVVFAVDTDGVFDRDPSDPEARLIKRLKANEKPAFAGTASAADDVTGGMASKVRAAQAIAFGGARVLIVNGLEPGRVAAAMRGESVEGTQVVPPGVVAR